jgi:UDP-N-acetylmuramoyl-L-alanyl-D-glutamate--2,6-diaminopimelate ligase
MNKLETILRKYSSKSLDLNFDKIERLTSILQGTTDKEVVFYKLTSDKSNDLLVERLKDASPGLIISNRKLDKRIKNSNIIVSDQEFEVIQRELANALYGELTVQITGITGTNGKTSTAWLLSEMLSQKGNVLVLGTMGAFLNNKKLDLEFHTTTPPYLDLRHLIQGTEKIIDFVIMEISSHALSQNRLAEIELENCAWTNFTQDHLDYHNTMEEYFKAKCKIAEISKTPIIVPSEQKQLLSQLKEKRIPFLMAPVFLLPESLKKNPFFTTPYNLQNMAIALGLYNNFYPNEEPAWDNISTPPGRFECIEKEENLFIVDYAHTPDALEKILKTIKESFSEKVVICVFGCGGDRDKTKRPLMGKAADQFSDIIIITSDNPRSENPEQIIKEIEVGVTKDHHCITDRREAIQFAAKIGKDNVIVVAGKGHENYQEIKGVKTHFDDCEVIKEL